MLTQSQRERLFRVANAVCRLARDHGIRAAVAGGIALHEYGVDRLTSDVDIIVDAPLPVEGTPLAIEGQRFTIDGVEVDALWCSGRNGALYREALDQAVVGRLGFPVVRVTHLAAIKTVVSRSRDIEDLERLLQILDDETIDQVRAVLGRHAPHTLPDFDASVVVAQLRRAVEGEA